MRQIRCSLCEGRIVDGRCQECGMYYRKTEGRYYLNENRREQKAGEPAKYSEKTKEYSAKTKAQAGVSVKNSAGRRAQGGSTVASAPGVRPARRTSHRGEDGKSKTKIGTIIYIIILLVVVGGGILKQAAGGNDRQFDGMFNTLYEDEPDSVFQTEEAAAVEAADSEDIYGLVQAEMPEEGISYSIDLTAGRYVVGQQIPEGIYMMEGGSEICSMYVNLQDDTNLIYHTWWFEDYVMADDRCEVQDVRLYTGAVLNIVGPGTVTLQSSNAQADQMQMGEANPLTEEVQVTAEIMTAGEDFPAGVYDAELRMGSGMLTVIDEEGYQEGYYFSLNEEYDSKTFRNLVLTPGMQVYQADNLAEETVIVLVPSYEVFPDEAEQE